ncbi:stage II sporulation protein D [Alkaliphilus hydrothermalis]|uniref:Stage II sporulation protein D n=1 Tax=Alkaliphilus hydrothermalis TaxID=1482730 RepID=A0ABS2NQC5_9FIRM|nr:stage II sporulation protein D [Alkaliphilus hydrothermalis]MBM7615136.1 stage II sporulation protein D [Alkaliphilus hydrothermalis]
MKGIFFTILLLIISTLLIPLLIVTTFELDIPLRDKPIQQQTIESDLKIKVLNHKTNEVMDLNLEEYVTNVVAAEVPASFEVETLKAQAVAARSYALWKMMRFKDQPNPDHPEADLCTDHNHCQAWLSKEELREKHNRLWMYSYWPKIQEAVEETRGIIMTYNMQPVEPLYHSTSGGRTENSEDVFSTAMPYLKSVSSPYEERAPYLIDTKKVSIKEFIKGTKVLNDTVKLKEKDIDSQIKILDRSAGGSVKRIEIGGVEFRGSDIRRILGLRSSNFTYDIKGDHITFTTRGYGHGVGMSQWGANGMAERGHTYEEILKHYYQGITLSKMKSYQN